MLLARRSGLWIALAALLIAAIVAFAFWPRASGAAGSAGPTSGRGLAAFESDDQLRAFLRKVAARRPSVHNEAMADSASTTAPAPMAMEAAPAPEEGRASESITNNQEAGVDEGGIVKNYRDMLVILRRGRVFTVSLADGGMRPIDSINAFPPGVSGRGDWYDEMLVSGDRVIVIGYSYARGGTEVNRFRITPAGQLSFEDAYHLRSNDYYSSRNYASRLIGNRLIYYTPLYLRTAGDDPLEALPGVRRWGPDGSTRAFRRITEAQQVFIAPRLRDNEEAPIEALHSVISCDLTARELDCDATAVLGPSSRSFYVSGNAVYLFVSDGWRGRGERAASSHIYRLPFDEEDIPSAIGARGAPVDQFSFREDPEDGRLDVLVRASGGDAMWRPEASEGAVALLQVPLRDFGDGSEEADSSLYRDLPSPPRNSYDFHNRFVGNYLLYGTGDPGLRPDADGGARPGEYQVVAVPVEGRGAFQLALPHGVQRIEVMGRDALVIGPMGGDLGFSAIHLDGREPRVGERYIQRASSEGESRSHAFFYRPDPGTDGASGTVGLPVARPVDDRYRRHFGTAAAMLFLRREQRSFRPAGELDARPADAIDDACQASCVDWYGNARPIFLGRRVFALLGYELVEGRLEGGRIRELDRTSFAPRLASARTD